MSRPLLIVISPAGMSTRPTFDKPDAIKQILGVYSVNEVKNHPVAFSIESTQGEHNWVASRWIGKPFYGTLIVLDNNGQPFPGVNEAWDVIKEIRSQIFDEVKNNAGD